MKVIERLSKGKLGLGPTDKHVEVVKRPADPADRLVTTIASERDANGHRPVCR